MQRRPTTAPKALSLWYGRGSRLRRFMLFWVCGLFVAGGTILFYLATLRPVAGVLASRTWQEVPCTITHSEVDERSGDNGMTYAIDIEYDYEFQKRRYHSDRYSFMGRLYSSGRSRKQAAVKLYPVGKQTTCYVDPENPDEAVLNRDWTAAMGIGAFGLPFMLAGTFGLLYAVGVVGRKGTGPPAALSQNLSARRATAGSLAVPDAARATAPIVLKPSLSPPTTFVAMTLVALFWNGITSIFVYQAVKSVQRGDPEWSLIIFISPFVLIGLVLIAVAIHSFGALFNPRPILTLSRGEIPLGQFATISWQFTGNVSVIRLLRITLQGEEKATYRRGTRTVRDSQTFWEDVAFESTDARQILEGEVDIHIPWESMHSFRSDNNEIAWSIHLAGEIARRPDVNYDFPIRVVPHEQNVD